MENEESSQVKPIENNIVLNEAPEIVVKTIVNRADQQFCGFKHNIYSSSDDEESSITTVLPRISQPNTASCPNTEMMHARTMMMYEVLPNPFRVLYRTTYSISSENGFYSTWTCSKLQHKSTAPCPASLTVMMKEKMVTVLDIGWHKCRNPSSVRSVPKWRMEEPSSSSPDAWTGKVYRGKTLQLSKISLANTIATMTVNDINTIPNFLNKSGAIVYTGRSLDQVETIIRQDKYKMQQLCNRVEIIYVSGTVYNLDPTDAVFVLRNKNNLDFVYYNGKTYRKYSHSFNELGYVNTRYRCNTSVECVSELRLIQDTSDTAYALRFEHHTCKSLEHDKNNIGIINDLPKFYRSVNSKYCYADHYSGKPSVYFHGYIYEYLNHMCDHNASSTHVCLQHKYRCHRSVINNCLAFLLFGNIREQKHILKVGHHTCKRKLLEVDTDDRNIDICELIADDSKIENNISFGSSDCKEEIDQYDIKNLLKCSIEMNQEINCLIPNLEGNLHDLNKWNQSSEISDSANSCVDECVDFFARREGSHNVDIHDDDDDDDDDEKSIESREKSQESNYTSIHISETKTLEIALDNKTAIKTKEKGHQAIETIDDVKKVLVTDEQSQNLSTINEVNHFCNIEAMEKKLEVENVNVYTTGKNERDKIPIPSSSYEDLDSQMDNRQVLPKHTEINSNATTLMSLVDHVTKKRRYTWHPSTPVERKYLGYIFGDMPTVDPNDSSTVYLMYSYNDRAHKKILHYMGYNYYKVHSNTRYECDAKHLCNAWLSLKDKKVAVFGQHTCKSSISLNSSTTQIHYSEDSSNAGELVHSDAIPSSTITSLDETHINAEVANYQDNDNTLELAPPLKLTQMEGIGNTKNCVAKREIEINCEDVDADVANVEDFVTEEPKSGGDVQDYDDKLNSLMELKKEEHIDIMEHRVDRIEMKIEAEKTPVNISDEEICCVKEEVPDNNQEIIDITLDDSEEEMVDNKWDNLYDAVWNEKATCEVTASNSSNSIINYDKVLLEYNGYEYHKENSGKFAWCKESKICSGMIKILPNDQGEIIGRHTCKGIREISDGLLEVYDIDQVNDGNEKAVKIKTLTSDPREMKSVPLKNQYDYQESDSGKSIKFCGYQYKKRGETGDTFICIHNISCDCPGMLQMLRNKIVRCCDHSCHGAKNSTSSATEDKRTTVLIYPNKLTSNPEAMYKGFTYRRTLRTSHVSVWQCTATSCTAVIKIYTFTTTLSEVGAHACISATVGDRSIKKKAFSFGVVKSSPIQKTCERAALPKFENKSIIAVYNDKDEINLIYQGNIYRGEGANWACIHLHLKGCKGSLRILDGAVTQVSKHDCFDESFRSTASLQNKYTNYNDFLTSVPTVIHNTSPEQNRTEGLEVFQGSNKKKFALYEGYVYKKFHVSRKGKVYKWICTNHILHQCEGVLTTNDYAVLATSQHRCKDEDNRIKDRGLFDYDGNNTKTRMSETMGVDTTSSGSTKSNKKDKKRTTKVNTKRKTRITEEIVPTKRFKRYENTSKSKGNKSNRSEEDIETLIPTTNIRSILVDGNSPGSGNQTKETHKKERRREVKKYGKFESRGCQYDKVNNPIELESESETEEVDVEAVDKIFICNEDNESQKDIVDFQSEIEFVGINCQDDNNDQQSELVSGEVDYDRLLSTIIKEENLDYDFAGEILKVKEEVEEIEDENVSMALTRGPNGEYFVHVKNLIDTNNPL